MKDRQRNILTDIMLIQFCHYHSSNKFMMLIYFFGVCVFPENIRETCVSML